jgi:hypothetical protein
LAEKKVSEETKSQMRKELAKKENEVLRQRRIRLTGRSFESLKIIGRGAFGEVHFRDTYEGFRNADFV